MSLGLSLEHVKYLLSLNCIFVLLLACGIILTFLYPLKCGSLIIFPDD